jgi:hypothetical protein
LVRLGVHLFKFRRLSLRQRNSFAGSLKSSTNGRYVVFGVDLLLRSFLLTGAEQ